MMSDNLDIAWVQRAERQTEGGKPRPEAMDIGQWVDGELERLKSSQSSDRKVRCSICGSGIDYPFRNNWIAWCSKCTRERWEEVMTAIMRLRDDG